jgi:perosamine synthetase
MQLFAGSSLTTPRERPGTRHVYQTYAVLLPEDAERSRADIIRRLREREIETNIATHHVPLTRYFRDRGDYRPGAFPVTDTIAARGLALPLHSRLTEDDQERVVRELRALL